MFLILQRESALVIRVTNNDSIFASANKRNKDLASVSFLAFLVPRRPTAKKAQLLLVLH